jgi:hemoglobin-like flavoprotein
MENYREVFSASYQRISDSHNGRFDFYDSFYLRFISSSPEIAEKFRGTDMTTQKKFLKESLVYMMNFGKSREAGDYLLSLAQTHSRKGKDICPYLYDVWLECMVETAKDFDPQFNQEVALAWRVLLAPGITFMKHKYDK